MAKRKRLTPAVPPQTGSHADISAQTAPDAGADARLETKAHYPLGVAPPAVTRAPIAHVAKDSATHAALEELVAEVDDAKSNGRLVQVVPLEMIKIDHLVRDRMNIDDDDMAALKASLQSRGQQTPIELIALKDGRYGLISGWRRMQAMEALHKETGAAKFAQIQALIKPIETVKDSYVAMVEENEIRSDLSFYERARLAVEAAKLGVYPTADRAVTGLFAHAPAAKRSKIKCFIRIHELLGDVLSFPAAIPEKLGLVLNKALEADDRLAVRLVAALRNARPKDPAAERYLLEQALKSPVPAGARPTEIAPGIFVKRRKDQITLSGDGVTPELLTALEAWLKAR